MPATNPTASTPSVHQISSTSADAARKSAKPAAIARVGTRCWSAVPATTPPTAGTPISTPLATSTLPYAPWSAAAAAAIDDRGRRRAGRLALAVAEPEDQQRHDDHPAADAEQP